LRSAGRANVLSARQRQVLSLVARGLTNKHIAHELAITERGVAAQISRMLQKFDAPNRAGLIARFLSDEIGQSAMLGPAFATADAATIPSSLERELGAYEDAPFFVGVTLGPNHVIAYQNRMSRTLTGENVVGRPHREAFTGDASQAWWLERTNEAFTAGRPVAVSAGPSRWQRDDGSWAEGVFNCVAQPLSDRLGAIRGVLWICTSA
jgi:DNA-binding CsgD family transcriptional regulator